MSEERVTRRLSEMDPDSEDEDHDNAVIVCDNGTGMIKAGEGGQDSPDLVFPNITGIPRHKPMMLSMGQKDSYVGQQAMAKRGILSLRYPIEHGIISDWDGMQNVWSHMYEEGLQVDAADHPILMTEAPLNPHQNREKMAEVLFENFSVPSFYIAVQGALALYAAGRVTGLVLDAGDGLAHTVPIYDGYALPHAMHRVNIGGRDLTEYMARLLGQKGIELNSGGELQIAREIKEKCCYVAADYQAELDGGKAGMQFELPDGESITIGAEAFKVPEVLFQPEMIGRDATLAIHKVLQRSVSETEMDLHKELYDNVVLCGGTTLSKGLPERLSSELSTLSRAKVKVLAPPERKYTVWIGGSIMSQLSHFQKMLISKEEYDEAGPRILRERCF